MFLHMHSPCGGGGGVGGGDGGVGRWEDVCSLIQTHSSAIAYAIASAKLFFSSSEHIGSSMLHISYVTSLRPYTELTS